MARKLAITGAAGALGRCVVRSAIDQGYDVIAFGRTASGIVADPAVSEAEWRWLDLTAPRSRWAAALDGCDSVVHLAAAKCEPDPSAKEACSLWESNVVASRELIAAMGEAGVPQLVLASSAYAFLASPSGTPLPTAHQSPGRILYLASKAAQESIASSDCATHGIRFAALRISSVIATGASAIDTLAARLARNEPVTLTGGGRFAADFVSASDVAQGLLLTVRDHLAGPFALSSGRRRSLRTVTDELCSLLGADPALVKLAMPELDQDLGFPAIDCRKLCSLGYTPEDLSVTLARIVQEQRALRTSAPDTLQVGP
jgi:nucleoside-diphosphate-sugar epimerase